MRIFFISVAYAMSFSLIWDMHRHRIINPKSIIFAAVGYAGYVFTANAQVTKIFGELQDTKLTNTAGLATLGFLLPLILIVYYFDYRIPKKTETEILREDLPIRGLIEKIIEDESDMKERVEGRGFYDIERDDETGLLILKSHPNYDKGTLYKIMERSLKKLDYKIFKSKEPSYNSGVSEFYILPKNEFLKKRLK